MKDRRELDDAVLEMIGVESSDTSKDVIDRLYAHLREHYEQVQRKEELGIANKKRAQGRGKVRPVEVAKQILREIAENERGRRRGDRRHHVRSFPRT